MNDIAYKKPFILFLYTISVLIFCFFYQNTNNSISDIFATIGSFVDDSSVRNILDKFSTALQSIQVQFPLRIITGIVGIYINSLFLFVVIKLWNVFNKTKTNIQFHETTQAFYLGLYVSILNYILLSIFMIITGNAMDYQQNLFSIFYSLWNFILGSFVVIYYLKLKYGILKPILLYFSLYFLVLLLIYLGGYYEWNIFSN